MPLPQRPGTLGNPMWYQRLTRAIDAGIASTVLFAPLFMGGRGPVGRFVFVLCVAITATLWCARQCVGERGQWRKSGAEWLLLAGLGVLVLQLLPLPQAILALVSPHLSELLPLWTPDSDSTVHLGIWNQVSLNPAATQSGLATYVAYAVLFMVTFQRMEELKDVQRLLNLIVIASCFLAIIGLAQFLFSNGKFLWVFEHVSRSTNSIVKGPFQNQNHFAHLLALGIGPTLCWLATLQGENRRRRANGLQNRWQDPVAQSQILWIALGIITLAALLTFSRGGAVSTLLASTGAVALLSWKRLLSRSALIAVAVIASLMVVSLSIHGYEALASELMTFRDSQSIEEFSNGRWALWASHLKAIPDFWLVGTGVGTHRDIYPTYLAGHFNIEFTHGECGYLQLALETGLLGCGLFLVGAFIAFRWAVLPLLRETDRTTITCAAAILPGLVTSFVHSLSDFVWYIPACMTTTVLLLAAACHLYHRSMPAQSTSGRIAWMSSPRPAWFAVCGCCVLAFMLLSHTLLGPARAASRLYAYQRLANAAESTNGAPPKLDELAARARHLEAAAAASPHDGRTHAQLAGLYLQQFDLAQQHSQNPMPLAQIRDAAIASEFPSKQALDDWLGVAVGENRKLFDLALKHAQRSVQLGPLQGESYGLLAGVAFLEGPGADRKRWYMQQALLVRPYQSRVLFVAGQEALLDGNVSAALVSWKKAFHGDPEIRGELIRELTAVIPVTDLLTVFEPDQLGLEALLAHYQRLGEMDSAKTVAEYYESQLVEQLPSETKTKKLQSLKDLARLYEFLENPDQAIRMAQEASCLAPTDFELKLQIGRLLVQTERFQEAQVELQWCARRRPDHEGARQLLATANRESLLRQADASMHGAVPQSTRQ